MRRALFLLFAASVLGPSVSRADDYSGSFGLGAGVVKPQGFERTGYYSLDLRFGFGEHVAGSAGGGYWRRSVSVPGLADASISTGNVDVSILGRVRLGNRARFEAGAGGSMFLFTSQLNVAGVAVDDTDVKYGAHVLGELSFGLTKKFGFFGQVRYDIVSDFNQFKALGGIRAWWE